MSTKLDGRHDFSHPKVTFLVAALVLLIFAGLIPAPGATSTFYVILPYASAVVSCGMSITSAIGLTQGRRAPKEGDEERHAKGLSAAVFVALASSLIAAAGELVFVMLNGLGGSWLAPLFMLLAIAAAACIWLSCQQ